MLYIHVVYCLLLGIVVAEVTQSLVTTAQSLGSFGHHYTGYYSIFQGIFFTTILFQGSSLCYTYDAVFLSHQYVLTLFR